MKRLHLAIAACAALLTVASTAIKVMAPSTGIILLADDGGPLPPPDPPDPPSDGNNSGNG